MGALLLLAIGSMAEDAPDFNREVRPILATRCFTCHGPDANTRKAKLRLDEREVALEILAPGKLADSELMHRVLSEDPDEMMPPPSLKNRWRSAKAVLKRWIAAGAVRRPLGLRPTAATGAAQGETGRLGAHTDRPFYSGTAGTGRVAAGGGGESRAVAVPVVAGSHRLPPTPTEVEAFLKDQSPNATKRRSTVC